MATRRSADRGAALGSLRSLGKPRFDDVVRERIEWHLPAHVAQERSTLGLVPAQRASGATSLRRLAHHQLASLSDRQLNATTLGTLSSCSRVLVSFALRHANRSTLATCGSRPPATPSSAMRLDPWETIATHQPQRCPQHAPSHNENGRESGTSCRDRTYDPRIKNLARPLFGDPHRIDLDAVATSNSQENRGIRESEKERVDGARIEASCPQDAPSVWHVAVEVELVHATHYDGLSACEMACVMDDTNAGGEWPDVVLLSRDSSRVTCPRCLEAMR